MSTHLCAFPVLLNNTPPLVQVVPELQITAGWDSTAICLVVARVVVLGQMLVMC